MKAKAPFLWTAVAVVLVGSVWLGVAKVPGYLAKSKAEKAVAAQLIDPSSAQFRRVVVSPDRVVVCGEVNGKNRLGAYTGFEGFFVRDGQDPRFESAYRGNAFDQLVWFRQWAQCNGIEIGKHASPT